MTKVGIASTAITVAAWLAGGVLLASHAAAQTAQDLVGTWTVVSIKADQDGNAGRAVWPQSKRSPDVR